MGIDPWITCRQRIGRNASPVLRLRVIGAHLGAHKGIHLVKEMVVQSEIILLPGAAHRLLHTRDLRRQRIQLIQTSLQSGGLHIIGSHIDIALQQLLALALQGCQQVAQRIDVSLQFDPLGIHAGRIILSTQLL